MQDNQQPAEKKEPEAQVNNAPQGDGRLTISSSDVLSMIAFEAQKIVAVTNHHAAGAQFPDPHLLGQTIDRMAELQRTLVGMQMVQQAKSAQGAPVN